MATKVTSSQIQSVNLSQINIQGGIEGDAIVAVRSGNGLTLEWVPASVLPRIASHGQVLTYDFYTNQWAASSINALSGTSALPQLTPNAGDIDKILTWNGVQWVGAVPLNPVTRIEIRNTDGALSVSTPNVITSTGTITINLSTVGLSKLNQGGASVRDYLEWNGTTWAPFSPRSVGDIRAMVLFNGQANLGNNEGILYSKNISSITDRGKGSYTINFASNTFQNSNYLYTFGINVGNRGAFVGTVIEDIRTTQTIQLSTGFVFNNDEVRLFDSPLVNLVFIA